MISWKKSQLHALKITSGNLKQAKTGKPKQRTWRVTFLMFQHSPWPRCKERGMLYVQAVSFPAVEKGLLFPWQTGNIFGLELIRILHPEDLQFLLRGIWRPPVLAKSVNFWALPESLPARLHARLPARHRGSPTRDTARVHGRLRTGNRLPPQKKPYVFNLVFELYINFSELYIKWSRTIYKFLRTIYKISGKIPGLPGESHGIPGQGLRAGKNAIELYPVDWFHQKKDLEYLIILGGLVDSWRCNQ